MKFLSFNYKDAESYGVKLSVKTQFGILKGICGIWRR